MEKTLNNGIKMPMLGFGTYHFADAEECGKSILSAIRAGYRLIDTAKFYRNEEYVGRAIREAFAEGLVKREELFVLTKVWYDSYETQDCRKSLEDSFEKLGLEQIDMVLLHWPFGNVYAAWRVLEEYVEAGRIRAIGVSNMEADRLIDLIHYNRIVPALNQIETHLYCQRIEEKKWLRKLGIAHQAYAPLGHGRANEMFEEPAVKTLAGKYGKTPAQVLIRFLLQSDVAVIPKSARRERIRENFDVFDFELTEEETALLRTLDRRIPMIGRPEEPEKVLEMLG